MWYVVTAAGDYDNRNLKDDGSSQALDYEEIERLKAGGLRDQVSPAAGHVHGLHSNLCELQRCQWEVQASTTLA